MIFAYSYEIYCLARGTHVYTLVTEHAYFLKIVRIIEFKKYVNKFRQNVVYETRIGSYIHNGTFCSKNCFVPIIFKIVAVM